MKSTLKKFIFLTVPISIVACSAEPPSSESKPISNDTTVMAEVNSEDEIATTEVSDADNDVKAKPNIVLYMRTHEQSGLSKSSKSDADYYRVLIRELPNQRYLVQDFFISGKKLTDPYILTDGKLEYVDNEDVAHPNNYYPREGARTVWSKSGNKRIESYYKNNMPTGTWIYYYGNKQKWREETYVNGEAHGVIRGWNEDGVLTHLCRSEYGKKDGRCFRKYNNNPNVYAYIGEYQKGEKIGVWKTWNLDGSIEKIDFYGLIPPEAIKESLSQDQFEIFTFDVNADDVDDLVISRINDASGNLNLHQGNELYVLTGDKSNRYTLSLSTSNFTDETGWFLADIYPSANHSGFILKILYSPRGRSNQYFHFSQKNKDWRIAKYISEGTLITGEDYYCIENNNVALSEFEYAKSATYSDSQLQSLCPPPPTKYVVKTDQAEILNEKFKSRTKPNYYIKGDLIEAFDQNEDWVKVAYKEGTKFGWIDKRDLSSISD